MAIYQGNTKISGAGIEVDSSLSDSSTNPVQNQAVTNALEDVGYDTWQKPSDWIDIRSGALANSVYFLVAHSADYSQYPDFFVNATISNSGTYDVFIDGIKQATTASATATTLNWQTLALETGFNVTTPTSLRAHIVRVTPSVSTNTITRLTCHGSYTNPSNCSGILWAHFTITTDFDASELFGKNGGFRSDMLQIVTSANGFLNVSRLNSTFFNASSLIEIPIIASQGHPLDLYAWGCFSGCHNLKKIVFDKIVLSRLSNEAFRFNYSLKRLEGVSVPMLNEAFHQNYSLEKLPTIAMIGFDIATSFLTQSKELSDTYLDLSWYSNCKKLTVSGVKADYFIAGLKGITVSNEAPFDGASPQLNVSYTGLDRAALVNLFKSMPYNVGYYEVVGSPTIVDGVASGFSENDYLQTLEFPFGDNSFEGFTKITTPDTLPDAETLRAIGILAPATARNGFIMQYSVPSKTGWRLSFYTWGAGEEAPYLLTPNLDIEPNTVYYARFGWDKTKYYIDISTDKTTWISAQRNATARPIDTNKPFFFGNTKYFGRIFDGSIDLNETYIKVNGVPWFTGKAAMTKTCSVVGCTGTADLTQDDKNIALNKGWALTVA